MPFAKQRWSLLLLCLVLYACAKPERTLKLDSDRQDAWQEIDSFWQQVIRCHYEAAGEQLAILPTGLIESYRMLYIPPFSEPVLITLNRNQHWTWMRVRQLDRMPQSWDQQYVKSITNPLTGLTETVPDTLIKANCQTGLLIDTVFQMKLSEWVHFERSLQQQGFWQMHPNDHEIKVDGDNWVLEGLHPGGCHVVHSNRNNGLIENLGYYLLKRGRVILPFARSY